MIVPFNETEWEDFVNENSDATIFHTLEWKRIIEKTFKYKSHYMLSKNEFVDGALPLFQVNSFVFGKRLIGLPFSFSAGPLYENQNILTELLQKAKYKSIAFRYLEIRSKRLLPNVITEQFKLKEYLDNYLSILELGTEESVWENMDRKHRNAVRKSEKEGLIVREATGLEDLKKYYNIKLKLAAKKYGIPSEPFKFYKNMWEELSPKGMLKILLAEYNGKIVAGIILFLFRHEILYFSGAAEEEYLYLKPYNLLIWEGIRFGCKNKYSTFNFGTSSHQGLLDFKEKWGAESSQIPIYTTETREESEKYNKFTRRWKKLPIGLSKLIGPFIVKQKGG